VVVVVVVVACASSSSSAARADQSSTTSSAAWSSFSRSELESVNVVVEAETRSGELEVELASSHTSLGSTTLPTS